MREMARGVALLIVCGCTDGTGTEPLPSGDAGNGPVDCIEASAPIDADDGYSAWAFVSAPDFLNFDLADTGTTQTSTNDQHEANADHVLSLFAEHDPAFVLVAGDQVMGHWAKDVDGLGMFGPIGTIEEREAAIRRAADLYYPAWKDRFDRHGLRYVVAIGDHEIGDGNPITHVGVVPAFKRAWAEHFGPTHAVYRHRNVAIVSLDVFHQDEAGQGVAVTVTGNQIAWLDGVLAQLCDDEAINHVIVQGHAPILYPVRAQNSSRMHVADGASSVVWRRLAESCVRAYFAGEVHDWDVQEDSGLTQITHGGLLGYAPDYNYLVATVHQDRIEVEIRLAPQSYPRGTDDKLWQTGANRPAAYYEVGPFSVVATVTLPRL